PFQGEAALETLRRVREAEPARPRALDRRIDRDLETVVLTCLQKGPRHRYGSALALADDLQRWLLRAPIAARPVGAPGALWRRARRQRVLAGLASLVLVLLATVAVGATAAALSLDRTVDAEREARDEAERERARAKEAQASAETALAAKDRALRRADGLWL